MKKIIITEKQARTLGLSKLVENYGSKDNKVDKLFKKEFSGKDIKGMLDEEIKEFVKYLYKESDKLSPFWENQKLSFEAICDNLKNKKIINQKNGLYEISKSIGEPKIALDKLKEELSKMINEKTINFDNHMLYGDDNYYEPRYTTPRKLKDKRFETLYYNYDIVAILKEIKTGNYFVFANLEELLLEDPEFREFCTFEIFDDDDDDSVSDEIPYDSDTISSYATLYFDKLTKSYPGEDTPLDKHQEGTVLTIIDDELKKYLMELHSNDSEMLSVLSKIGLNENENDDISGFDIFKKSLSKSGALDPNKQKLGSNLSQEDLDRIAKEKEKQIEAIISDPLFQKMMARKGTPPWVIKFKNRDKVNDVKEVVDETTTAGSSGQYTASAFSMNSPTEFSNKKPKAFKKTQYAGGGFVKFKDECVKLNNKPAGAGCSQGAANNVVSISKTKGNVNAPSLNEGQKKKSKLKESLKTKIDKENHMLEPEINEDIKNTLSSLGLATTMALSPMGKTQAATNEKNVETKIQSQNPETVNFCKLLLRENRIKQYKINPDGTVDINGFVNLRDMNLVEIPIKFNKIYGSFDCSRNKLKILKNCPDFVSENFSADDNQLISLKYSPTYVGGEYSCAYNNLTNLEGIAETIGRNIWCKNNNLISFEGLTESFIDPDKALKTGNIYCENNPIYEIYKLFGNFESYYNSLRYDYLNGTTIDYLKFKNALKEIGKKAPEKLQNYKYQNL